jgi:uncharacterized protein
MVPVRTCVGCRRVAPAGELVRLARSPGDGRVRIGAGPGRGAWLCGPPATLTCFDQAVRRRALDRALRATMTDDELRALRAKLAG